MSGFKYFILTGNPKAYSRNFETLLLCWTPNCEVELDEDVENYQYLNVSINKLDERPFAQPKTAKYQRVKPILPELFNDYYSLLLSKVSDTPFEDNDEYFERYHHKGFYEVQYFAGKNNEKFEIGIRFTDDIKSFSVSVSRSHGFSYRSGWVRSGVSISKEKFLQYFNLTIQFLADYNSYLVFLDEYTRYFPELIAGDTTFKGLFISPEQTLNRIIEQLESRKQFIEKRLINSDSDTNDIRRQLRGELDGLLYAIKTIKQTL